MQEPIKFENLTPQFPEPTQEEIEKATEEFKNKFDKELSKEDAVKYANLRNELGYWLTLEKESEKENCISKKIAEETQELFQKKLGQEITLKQAYLEAEKLFITSITDSKIKVTNEIRELINKYK